MRGEIKETKNKKELGKQKTAEVKIHEPFAATLLTYANLFNDNSPKLMGEIYSQIQGCNNKIINNDFSDIETILVDNIYTLQTLSNNMILKASSADYAKLKATYIDLALKAQNNMRRTIEALHNIKRPSNTTFIKNQAHNQQVNFNQNSIENKSANELLNNTKNEVINYEKMDTRSTPETSPINS